MCNKTICLVVCILTRCTGSPKYGTTRKNTQRYYTTKRLIRYIYSSYTGRKISPIVNKYCKDFKVKIIFSPFKLSAMFSPKDFPDPLKSHVVYQFTCASCGACYIGETNRHFNVHVNEHNSHIFEHLNASKGCQDKRDISCFKIIDHASTYAQLIK